MSVILAIESSCDETAIAIMENGQLKSHQLRSQIKVHAKYGGVIPEAASRMHAECIHYLIEKALEEAEVRFEDLTHIAATYGPGLEGSLLIGMIVGKTIASMYGLPFLKINHLQGHIYANYLGEEKPTFPYITLIASGGHTLLVKCSDHFQFEILGSTRDDAAGEAFDKVARLLELGYPGGPKIETLAKEGNETAIKFPRSMIKDGLEFSFSGLKTAVMQTVKDNTDNKYSKADIAASFQDCVADILVTKALRACDETDIKEAVFSGGVTANRYIMGKAKAAFDKAGINLISPGLSYCTDNAAMIAMAAHFMIEENIQPGPQPSVNPSLLVSEL